MATQPEIAAGEGQRLLERCTLFRTLDDEARQELASRAHRRRFMAGEVIFHSGSPGQSMMAVLSGTVRISMTSVQGREIVLADIERGDVFGEIAMLDGKERTADATALTNCELMVLERREVLPFIQRHPDVALKLIEVVCERLRGADERFGEIAFLELPVRLARALLRAARQSGMPAGDRGAIRVALSQRDLGAMIGGTRESVNRCLSEWQRRGTIELRKGWIVIPSPEALVALAELR